MHSFINEETPAGDFEKIAVSTTAVGIASTKTLVNEVGGIHNRAVKVFITVEDNDVRARWDGTDPDSSTGHLLTVGSSLVLSGAVNIRKLRFIRATADAVVQVTIYKNS
jgi:hypothetical protein